MSMQLVYAARTTSTKCFMGYTPWSAIGIEDGLEQMRQGATLVHDLQSHTINPGTVIVFLPLAIVFIHR